jgi:hypothetical protein
VEQIDENLKSFELYKNWTKEIEEKCDKALGNLPEADIDFRNSRPFAQRRHYAVFDKPAQ